MHMIEDLLTETDVAKKLRVTLACLRRWRLERRGPKFIKLGALVRYRPDDIADWLESRPVGGTPNGTVVSESMNSPAGKIGRSR
jgi:predicted DNA-binding transcriptional regulator AlpA